MRKFFSRYGRWLLLLVGVVAITALILKIGPEAVLKTLLAAGLYLPLILLLDFGWMAFEGGAVALLLGKSLKKITWKKWLEATLIHYATFTVVPMGRTSAEVTRASLLAPLVGKSRAAAMAAVMQSMTLSANAIVSSICLAAVYFSSAASGLLIFLLVNILVTGSLGSTMYLVMRHVKVGGRLGKRFKKLQERGPELDEHIGESRPRHLGALAFCVGGRLIQTAQYGVILLAVSGTLTLSGAFTAEGIQLVGRSMGDMIPNQVGVTEGTFSAFAEALGLKGQPEKAVSLALLGRVSNLSIAGLCALLVQVLHRSAKLKARS